MFAFVFPGQGSQALNMMDNLAQLECVAATFAEAKQILGIDFAAMLHEETAENINQTINTQPLLLTASVATYRAWLEVANLAPSYVAGHSLGEYSALVASGVLEFARALELVRKRAEYMQQAVAPGVGAMAAVLGLEDEVVIATCNEIMSSTQEVVQGVNFNAPGQVVIAGVASAVAAASELLKERGARKVMPLPVSVPSHCKLMEPAAAKLALELAKVEFKPAQIPVIQNVNGQIATDAAILKDGLIKQLYSPVLWTTTVQTLAAAGVNSLIECGPGKVLSGLNKRIHVSSSLFNLASPSDLDNLRQALSA